MIITNKQIMIMLVHLGQYINTLKSMKETNGIGISAQGERNIQDVGALIAEIVNQQSDKLIDTKPPEECQHELSDFNIFPGGIVRPVSCNKCGKELNDLINECQHESDGKLSIPPGYTQYMETCKKCGEFYR